MGTNTTDRLDIPKSYSEIYDFICENKHKITADWEQSFTMLQDLDALLPKSKNMNDLHKDTQIILEAMKMLRDILLKEFRNEITFDKILYLADNGFIDDFFQSGKDNSQTIRFLDTLDFQIQAKNSTTIRKRSDYNDAIGVTTIPETLEEMPESKDSSSLIHELHRKVELNTKIEYFHLICDPFSYSKTILNAFNVSLALRQKLLSLKAMDSLLYVVPYEACISSLEHSVLEITPKQYRDLKDKLFPPK